MSCETGIVRVNGDGKPFGEWLRAMGIKHNVWVECCRRVDVSDCEAMVEAPSCIEEFELDDDERRCYCQLVVRLVQGFRVDLDEAMRVANKNLVFGRREGRGGGLVDGGRHTSYRRHDGEWSGSWDDICNCQEGV